MQDFNSAFAYVQALTGDANNAIIDWRACHDQRKDIPALPRRGTIHQCWPELVDLNNQGYGIFAVTSAMDGGQKRELSNVLHVRAQFIDLDNVSALQNYERAVAHSPQPTFAVQTSPNKFHVYWTVQPYSGNDYFTLIQRKLRQLYDGDKSVMDATRLMRVPGTYHTKAAPHLVTCWAISGQPPIDVRYLEQSLAAVNVIDGAGGRHDLGDPELAAPSLQWLQRAMDLTDPNMLDRYQWVSFTAAVKQAGWTLTDPETLFTMWSNWCARYAANDPGENLKNWNSIRNSEVGWPTLSRRVPTVHLDMAAQQPVASAVVVPVAPPPPMPEPPPLDCSGEILTYLEQQEWFKGCTFVANLGTILTAENRFLNSGQFNAIYGGKHFIISSAGKTTDEPWKAATRSTLWQIPKVDHIRFVPDQPYGAVIMDDLGRKGINTYRPATVKRMSGDPSPFLRHIALLLPDPTDQAILLGYLAHNVRFPGHKIPWAPVLQSVEGVGKGVLKMVIGHCMGRTYTHFPNAKDLADSGQKFNAWMRNKLFILADEIKVDDRRDMIEVLKPMISEETIEIQAKGHDQSLEDNPANWMFFTNYRDAVPINKNSRRFSILYSAIQSVSDLEDRQMGDGYFNQLYAWLKADGCAIVADYLFNYPIERGQIPMRAPKTSSMDEAVRMSLSPIERMIAESIEDQLPGFRGDWISATMLSKRIKDAGMKSVSMTTLESILTGMGYKAMGRSHRSYMQEDSQSRSNLFHLTGQAVVTDYGKVQGWE